MINSWSSLGILAYTCYSVTCKVLNVFSWSHAERSRVMDFRFLSWLIPVKFLAIGQAPRSQVCAWPCPLVFLCPLSSSATLTWSSWSLCPASEDFYGSDTSLCNHWPCTLEPSVSFVLIHFINWCSGEQSASFHSLETVLCVSCNGSASDWCALQEALYKCIDTVQYNDTFA